MRAEKKYRWEYFPEYEALQQYSRCLGAIIASARPRLARRIARPLIRMAVMISTSLALAHAEDDPADPLPLAERQTFRDAALEGVQLSREALDALRGSVSRPHLTAALELLERVEAGVRERPLPAAA